MSVCLSCFRSVIEARWNTNDNNDNNYDDDNDNDKTFYIAVF